MYQANVAVGSFMTDVADLACRFMSLRSPKATDVLRCREMTRRANNRHLTPGYVATAYTRSDAYFLVPPGRTIGAHTSLGARSRLFSRYSSPGLKRIIRSGWITAWAAANEPGKIRQLCRHQTISTSRTP